MRIDRGQLGGALLIAVVTVVNYFGLQAGAGLQNAIAAVKILALVALIVFGLAATPEPATAAPQALSTGAISVGLGVAMIGVLWCFDGWYQAAFCAGEVRDPGAKSAARHDRRRARDGSPLRTRQRRLPSCSAPSGSRRGLTDRRGSGALSLRGGAGTTHGRSRC